MLDIILDQIVGLLILVTALLYMRFQPRRVNPIYGYRTTRSMKNDENWKFSNKLAAKYMLIVGVVSLIIGVPFSLYGKGEVSGMVNMIISLVGLVVVIPVVEYKLKNYK